MIVYTVSKHNNKTTVKQLKNKANCL